MSENDGGCGCGPTTVSKTTPEDPCLLPTDERDARLAMLRQELLPRAVHRQALTDGVAWEFPADPDLRRKLDELVDFERVCCPGLTWELEETAADRVRLRVGGLDPDSPLLASAGGEPAPQGRRLPAWLRSGGVGLGISFVLFCVVPVGLAAVGGAAVASQVSGLDDPLVIGAGAVGFGAVAFWFEHRRRRRGVAA